MNEVHKRRDRPFPWPCANCLKDEVYPETMPYTTEVKHDGRAYKLTISALTIPKCRACGELIFSNSVDDQILEAMRAKARLLTPQQIKEGRKALGLKSKELAKRLGVADATVSRWEQKRLIQSRAMDNFLRVFFAVPQARAVLQGSNPDVSLGTPAVPCSEAERPATDLGVNRRGEEAMTKTMKIEKSTRHSKIIGEFGEAILSNWLSRSGFEVTVVDHIGLDVIAYHQKTGRRLGITVKSRTRDAGKEAESVNVFFKRKSDRVKLEEACNAFGCNPWVAVYVETTNFADLYLMSLEHFDRAYCPNKSCAIDAWKMGERHMRAYESDENVQHIHVEFRESNWTFGEPVELSANPA